MLDVLLKTKLFTPLPPTNQVLRSILIKQLNEGLSLGRALTLISAPAGYGKTVLVAEWAKETQTPITWLSLDDADDDPLRFFQYFITALQKVDSSIGPELMVMLRSGQLPAQEIFVTLLVNDIFGIKKYFCMCAG